MYRGVFGKYFFCIMHQDEKGVWYYDHDEDFNDYDMAIEAAMKGEHVAVFDGTCAYLGEIM